ncbi:MAG: group III truncated hemoglobin, partial [Burkholderiales bacterium]|nr:group III truncated hemoglobin [Burkholderiales bacterium]
MYAPDLCTDGEIADMVHAFYAKVRCDEVLGPIFETHIDDWDHHLAKLVDFWSSVLRGTRRFSGAPMPKHAALPGLN